LIPSLSDIRPLRRALAAVFPTSTAAIASVVVYSSKLTKVAIMSRHGQAGKHKTGIKTAMKRARARDLAVAAFEFVASEPARIARFLDMTGITIDTIRAAAEEPRFLAGVLDHVTSEEPLLLAFARQSGVEPNEIVAARDILMDDSRERDTP
jgi:hypothetical protein